MKLHIVPRSRASARNGAWEAGAFTLIEMIGVLAVIAILAALLIPRIFEAINNARINGAVVTCSTIKAAVADHYAKFGSIAIDGSQTPPTLLVVPPLPAAYTNFDQLLLREGFLDKPFSVKLGDGAAPTGVQVRAALPAGTPADATNSAYDLGGTGSTNTATGSVVVEAVITGVLPADAKDLNDRLDGNLLGADGSGSDVKGRVKYGPASGATTTVYIYITHR